MTITPEMTALARDDAKSYDELKAKYADWLWKICQRNDDDAERARVALHATIDAHHANARALADRFVPRPHRSITQRPLSGDERQEIDDQRRQRDRRRAAGGSAPNKTVV
jgi:hypothetical protein